MNRRTKKRWPWSAVDVSVYVYVDGVFSCKLRILRRDEIPVEWDSQLVPCICCGKPGGDFRLDLTGEEIANAGNTAGGVGPGPGRA